VPDLQRLDEALTSKKWKFEFLTEGDCPKNISDFFLKYLPHLEPQSMSDRLNLGGFYVNGITISENVPLCPPCKVEYYEPKFNLNDAGKVYPAFSDSWIIHEDQHLLVVFKPRSLPCLATKEQKLFNLRTYLGKRFGNDLHMPSRLDTSTSGLVAVSKDPIMHNYLQKAFERKIIVKRYMFQSSDSVLWKHKTVDNLIAKSSSHAILREINALEGKRSTTIFTALRGAGSKHFYLARPLTGRTHQIRLHAASLSIPILGDNFYGGERSDSLHLLSYQLELWHPYEKKFLEFSVPYELLPDWALYAVY
jgi:23S rRNA-/tRNA-specific pseudouridylate synthase